MNTKSQTPMISDDYIKTHSQTPMSFYNYTLENYLQKCFRGATVISWLIFEYIDEYPNYRNSQNQYFYSPDWEKGYVFDNNAYCHQKMTSFDLSLDCHNNVYSTIVYTNSSDLKIKLIFKYVPDLKHIGLYYDKYITIRCSRYSSPTPCAQTLDYGDIHCTRCCGNNYGYLSTDKLKNWLARKVMNNAKLQNEHKKNIDGVFLPHFYDVNAVYSDECENDSDDESDDDDNK
jgi:hypothetical protein